MIYVKVNAGGYKGWVGVLNGVIQEKNPADTVVSVSIAPPPDFGALTEVYLPQGWLTRMQ